MGEVEISLLPPALPAPYSLVRMGPSGIITELMHKSEVGLTPCRCLRLPALEPPGTICGADLRMVSPSKRETGENPALFSLLFLCTRNRFTTSLQLERDEGRFGRRTDDTRARLSSRTSRSDYAVLVTEPRPQRCSPITMRSHGATSGLLALLGALRFALGSDPVDTPTVKDFLRRSSTSGGLSNEREKQSGVLTARSDRHWRLCLHGWRRALTDGGWTVVETKQGVGSR